MSWAVWLSTAVAIAGAMIAVLRQNILHAVLGLAAALLGVAALFFALQSPFVAAMEVLVYVGGISVAMVFAVMLSHSIAAGGLPESRRRRLVSAVPVLGLFVVLASAIGGAEFTVRPTPPPEAWSVRAIGRALLTHYGLVFEALSVVLLLAIVGAIAVAKKEPDAPGEDVP